MEDGNCVELGVGGGGVTVSGGENEILVEVSHAMIMRWRIVIIGKRRRHQCVFALRERQDQAAVSACQAAQSSGPSS
jgi:hypothetical protein